MNLKSIRWRLPVSYAAIALLAALSLGSVMLLVLNGYYAQQEQDYLLGNARALQPLVEGILMTNALPENFQDTVNSLAFFSQTRIRVLDKQGTTIVDSGIPNPNQMISFSGGESNMLVFAMPFDASVASGTFQGTGIPIEGDGGQSVGSIPVEPGGTFLTLDASPFGYGFSATTSTAAPSNNSTRRSSQKVSFPLGDSLGTLEISDGPAYGWDIIRSVSFAWAGAGVVAVLLAALIGWFASRQVTQPVLILTDVTQRMEAGDLAARASMPEKRTAAEFQALAHSFNGMAQRVENTVITLRAFVADAAHELHTPLTALHTNLELVADESDPTRRALYLERAQEQDQRLETLVGGLLNLSRIEAAKVQQDFIHIKLNDLLVIIAEQFAPSTEEAGIHFALELKEESVVISGNESQLRQIVTNLLENALKFTSSGGTITLTLDQIEGDVVIKVSDTGIGIPVEDMPHLFERFHRGRNASRFPGSGLGLAIVKALVDGQGGSVRAESEVGAGTCIIVTLPQLNIVQN